jgi:hypothetical protein
MTGHDEFRKALDAWRDGGQAHDLWRAGHAAAAAWEACELALWERRRVAFERMGESRKLRKWLEEATESNAAIASAHWELCKRLEAAEEQLVLEAKVSAARGYQAIELGKRLESAEKALRRAEQTIRNAALGFAAGDARTILLNEASNCAAALKEPVSGVDEYARRIAALADEEPWRPLPWDEYAKKVRGEKSNDS